MIDLHTHSSASDGSFSPSELIFYCAEKGLSAAALTDHDTLSGLEEASKAAQQAKIEFIPGIELNIQWPQGEFHMLGLGIDNPSGHLYSLIDFLQENRKKRNDEILKKLKNIGICISRAELEDFFHTPSLGRPHIADYLALKKIVKTRQQAFDRYLAKGRPCYAERRGADVEDAVHAIKKSGGLPVLAHPMSLYLSWGKLPGVLEELFEKGIAGIEAWHPGARVAECKRLEETGKRIGFFITAGSDFHGEKRPDRKIGKTAGQKPIDERFLIDELQPALIAARNG
ncbi:PHP domain-containing protein [Treponema sp. OMZ 840]|uniref:PHP domain-containing protein n=1 Tax=Treponema sp. OMZ 840 TaxID=244313 RepID=UPI003D8CF19A